MTAPILATATFCIAGYIDPYREHRDRDRPFPVSFAPRAAASSLSTCQPLSFRKHRSPAMRNRQLCRRYVAFDILTRLSELRNPVLLCFRKGSGFAACEGINGGEPRRLRK